MRTHPAALTALALLTLTACSGTADNPPATASPKPGASAATDKPEPADTDRAAVEQAVRAYSAAYFKPDAAAAHRMLSARCAAKAQPAVYRALVEQTETLGRHEIRTLTVDQISGDMARVSYTYDVPKLSQQAQPWVREDGAWKHDAC
jgi:hypothetical protein